MDRHGFAVLIVVDDSERDVDAHGIDVLKPLSLMFNERSSYSSYFEFVVFCMGF